MPFIILWAWLGPLMGMMGKIGGAIKAMGGSGGGGGIMQGVAGQGASGATLTAQNMAQPAAGASVGPPAQANVLASGTQGSQGIGEIMGGGPMKKLPWFSEAGKTQELAQSAAAPKELAVSPSAAPPEVRKYGVGMEPPNRLEQAKAAYDKYNEVMDYIPQNKDPGVEQERVPHYVPMANPERRPDWSVWLDKLRGMQSQRPYRRY
jgi:hypothetical protein